MKKNYYINLYDGHLIIEDAGRTLLLDTGSPMSLTQLDGFEFMGKRFKGMPSFGGKGIKDISRQLGKEIDVLVGLDVMAEFTFKIDYANRNLKVTDEVMDYSGSAVTVRKTMLGALIIKMEIDGTVYDFVLDTGAKISYINRKATSNDIPSAEREDFNPMMGTFKTPIFPKQVSFGGKSFQCQFGNLPHMAEMALSMAGIEGVIGFDLFNAFDTVLDIRNGKLTILDV